LERLGPVTLLECKLETGRTHQIRVHMEHSGHPSIRRCVLWRQSCRQRGSRRQIPGVSK
jgi:23S rRNA-/tRNA-specific pseudouridylate synthase